ncbi:hypothetical protein SDC9_122202 [bioreactor metagenome]|uniref:Uncharacterized protein n=1 Tax=bioreactor metagenome TaxID=1076179 RepID=A0A645CE48_9ZZZZ
MGDDEDRAVCHQLVHAPLDELFCPGINGAGGFVQNQHRGIGKGRAGDVQKLSLPLTETAAVAGENRLIPLRQVPDEVIRVGKLCRRLHLLVRCV